MFNTLLNKYREYIEESTHYNFFWSYMDNKIKYWIF